MAPSRELNSRSRQDEGSTRPLHNVATQNGSGNNCHIDNLKL